MTVPIGEGYAEESWSVDGQGVPHRAQPGRATWAVEKRLHPSKAWEMASVLLALLAALGVSSILIAAAEASVPQALAALARGAFGGRDAIVETLVQATPLIFAGLAVTVAFRGRIWNIGAEGQFFAGAMGAFWMSAQVGGVPPVAQIVIVALAASTAGALWGAIPGFLKARYGANEIIVTVMMNFIILYLLSFLLSSAWRDPSSFFFQTALIPESAFFPRLLAKGRLHLGFVLAMGTAAFVYILLWKTTLGYEIRALGMNPRAAGYKGISIARTTVLIMAISGAIAGLAGGSEVAGLHHRLRLDISTGYGFTGIIIAMLGGLHPLGGVLAAIFFGALTNGSSSMQIATGVPVALIGAIQGITLIFLLVARVLPRYRIRRTSGDV